MSREAGATESTTTRLIKYHGLRPTDPGGRLGLRNPERGWRIEAVIAEPAQKTFGPDQEDWWMWDAGRFEPFGLTLVQAYCYLTEFADKPISDGWFEDGLGQPAACTEFEYLQDHLGYRLELQSARLPEKVPGVAEFRVDIELVNRGFATLCNPSPVCLTLMDRAGKVTELAVTGPATPAPSTAWQKKLTWDTRFGRCVVISVQIDIWRHGFL